MSFPRRRESHTNSEEIPDQVGDDTSKTNKPPKQKHKHKTLMDFIENNFANIKGHEDIEKQFVAEFNNDKMHHAYLLSGVKGIGKASVALRLAYFLLTQHKANAMFAPEGVEVDAESSDYSQMKQGITPDLMYLGLNSYERYLAKPEDKSEKTIKVEAMKKIEAFLMQSASIAEYKVVIIDSYEALNKEGVNSILKIVEEPPKKCVFFIISHTDNVLPTIKSRCRKLNFKPIEQDVIINILGNKLGDAIKNFAVNNSGGSVGTAQALAKEKLYNLYMQISTLLAANDIDIGRAQEIGKVIDKEYKKDFALITLLIQQIIREKVLHKSPHPTLSPEERAKIMANLWFEVGEIGIDKNNLNLSGEHAFVEIARKFSKISEG